MAYASNTHFRLPKSRSGIYPSGRNAIGARFFLFILFAGYGASFNFAGQLRYVELIVLIIGMFMYERYSVRVDKLEWKLSAFFILTAAVQALSNFLNDAPTESTIARVGTYLVLAALVPTLAVIINRDPKRLVIVILGYCLSYVLIFYEGASLNDAYNVIPWRLGLGTAATLSLVTAFYLFPRLRYLAPALLVLMAGLDVYLESRSLAVVTILIAIYALARSFGPQSNPNKFRFSSLCAVMAGLGLFAFLGLQAFTWMAEAKLLPDSMIEKNQMQAGNSYGFFAAARTDTFVAMYAITKRPIIGYGSGVFDADVFGFYAEVTAASYHDAHVSSSVFKNIYEEDWSLGIPSHSHLFGAWADGGVFAALSWMFVLGLVVKMLVRTWRWDHPFALLFAFVGIMTIWDVLFSPGPVRMDMAIRLVIVATAFRYFSWYDAKKPLENPSHFEKNSRSTAI
jgi:hypothetical protein